MTLLLTTEQRLTAGPAGWLSRNPLTLLADVQGLRIPVAVLAREDAATAVGGDPVSVEQVEISPAPGPVWRWPTDLLRMARSTWAAVGMSSAVVAVVPGVVGPLAALTARARRRPLGVLVVGDAAESLARGAVSHPLRAAVRWPMTALTRWACGHADTALYVTSRTLQDRYRPGPGTAVYAASDVGRVILAAPRKWPGQRTVRVLTVASMDQPYKGIDALIDAVATLRQGGLPVLLTVVGEGRLRSMYQSRARSRLGDAATFTGALSRAQVDEHYQAADLFVLASVTEGLPRALVEAMAQGLPCVATAVGGIPELLDPACLVPARDADALASSMTSVLQDPDLYCRTSGQNIETVRALMTAEPEQVRAAFLHELLARSQARS